MKRAIAILLPGTALAFALVSLNWRFTHDTAVMLYLGYLLDVHQLVPYRDVFDMNPPGTLLVHQWIHQAVGHSDFGMRLLDLACLTLISAAVFVYTRRWGTLAAIVASSIFCITYLAAGPTQSLQREYLCLLPIAIALLLAMRWPTGPVWLRAAAIGTCFGLAAVIKPLLLIGLPVLMLGMLLQRDPESWRTLLWMPSSWIAATACALGAALPVLATLLWLERAGGLPGFQQMVGEYWPLYAQLGRRGDERVGWLERLIDFRKDLSLRVAFRFAAVSAIGVLTMLIRLRGSDPREKLESAVLVGLAGAFAAYVLIGGKFFSYHWMPFWLVASILAGVACADEPPIALGVSASVRAALVGALILLSLPAPPEWEAFLKREPPQIKKGRVEQIYEYLEPRIRPSDTVQPLGATGGAIHAMLLLDARIATPFIYDFHFYHHRESAITKRLRERMIEALSDSQPRFVVHFKRSWAREKKGRTALFEELDDLLESEYEPGLDTPDFRILERRDLRRASAVPTE